MVQKVKSLSTLQETWVRSLGWEDSLEKEMATHSSTLVLKIPWTEELGAGCCPSGHKESGMTELFVASEGKEEKLQVLMKSGPSTHTCCVE